MKLFLIALFSMAISTVGWAQRPGNGPQFDPSRMAGMEKQLLLDSISGLNDDQKLIINEIYKDFAASTSKAMETRDPNNREAMREKMMNIRKEKDDALKAILTEKQFSDFQKLLERQRAAARKRRQGGRNE